MVETVWQGEDYEIIINSAGRRHCRDRDTGVFVDMDKCRKERRKERVKPPVTSKEEMISKGKRKYKKKVGRIGASTYYSCGEKDGMAVAACLKAEKKRVNVGEWADRWAVSMRG